MYTVGTVFVPLLPQYLHLAVVSLFPDISKDIVVLKKLVEPEQGSLI